MNDFDINKDDKIQSQNKSRIDKPSQINVTRISLIKQLSYVYSILSCGQIDILTAISNYQTLLKFIRLLCSMCKLSVLIYFTNT